MKTIKYLLAALALVLPTTTSAQDFRTDRVITAAEIEPAVKVMNEWSAKLYPAFKLKYSSDPNAQQAQGQLALKGTYRVIALLTSKYLSTGAKSTVFLMGQRAKPETAAYLIDQIKAASYPEGGKWEEVTLGNLNDTPGSILVGLAESGAKLPGPSQTTCPTVNVSAETASIRSLLNEIDRKTR